VVVRDRIAVIGGGPFGENLVGEFANAAESVVEGRRRTAVEEGHEDGDGGRRIIVICRTGQRAVAIPEPCRCPAQSVFYNSGTF
jgi:hypothetical protein